LVWGFVGGLLSGVQEEKAQDGIWEDEKLDNPSGILPCTKFKAGKQSKSAKHP
jgi:hypothetical protein